MEINQIWSAFMFAHNRHKGAALSEVDPDGYLFDTVFMIDVCCAEFKSCVIDTEVTDM